VKPGYECSAAVSWVLRSSSGDDPLALAEGQLTLSDISDSEADVWGESSIVVAREEPLPAAAGGAQKAVRSSFEQLRGALRSWVDELRTL
jgi:hypothetical protein